jgi:hypothetical protein
VDVALFHANKATDGKKSTDMTELIVTSSGTAFLKRWKVLGIKKISVFKKTLSHFTDKYI